MSASTTPTGGTNVAAMPKRSHHGPLKEVKNLQDAFDHPDFMNRIKQAVPKHLSPDRMLAVFVQSVQKTPKLRECNMMSLLGAFLSVASVGLEPNTALQHAHLIPFDKKGKNPQTGKWEVIRTDVNIIFGYQGLLELAFRSGLLRSVHADVAWEKDEFDFWYGSGANLRHKPLGGTRREGELPVWAYMHANLKGDAEAFEVMPMSDVLAIRDSTQAYSSALYARDEANKKGYKIPASYTEAPWVKHFVPMAKKTVFRAGSKWLPKSIELASAIALDELQERHSPNYGAVIEGSANVLDGGLEALPDEHTGRMDVDIGSAFSTQESRQTEEVRTETTGRPDKQQQRQAPKEEPKQTTAPTTNTGFSAYLYDEFGELLGDEYTNAMSYAQALKQARRGVDVVANFVEANADGIADARAANSAARSIIDEILPSDEAEKPTETAQTGTGPGPLAPVPLTDNSRGTPAWPLYVKALKESLVTIGAINLNAWVEINLPRILNAPNAQRLQIIKWVTEHAAAVGATVPDTLTNAILPRVEFEPAVLDPASDDRDMKWAIATIAEMNRLATADDIRELAKALQVKNKMERLSHEKKALFTTVDNAFRDAIAARSQPTDAAEDGIPTDDGDPGPSDYRA